MNIDYKFSVKDPADGHYILDPHHPLVQEARDDMKDWTIKTHRRWLWLGRVCWLIVGIELACAILFATVESLMFHAFVMAGLSAVALHEAVECRERVKALEAVALVIDTAKPTDPTLGDFR